MKSYWQRKQEIDRLFNAPKHRKLKYTAIAVIGIAITTQIAMIIWIDKIPFKTLMFLRGCVGLEALIFVVLITILSYKVYTEHINKR